MKTDDALNDKNPSRNGRLALMVFSIGAIIGAVISLVLSRADRIKAFFQQTPPPFEPGVDGEPSSTEIAEQVTDLSSNQISLAPGNPSTIAPVQMPTASSAVPTAGLTSRISLPVAKTAVAVASPASNRWSAPTRYIMGVFLFLSVIVVLFIGRSVIPMVIGAALLALLVDPLIRFMMRRMRMKKGLAVGLIYFLVVAIVVLIPLLAVPSLVQAFNFVTQIDTQLVARQLSEVIQSLSSTLQASPGLSAILQPTLDSLSIRLESYASESQVGVSGLNLSVADLTSGFGKAMGTLANIMGPTFSVIASLFFSLLMSLQMSLTAEAFTNWYADLIPTDYSPELNGLLTNIRQTWTGFLRGQMTLMLLIGFVIWLGATILGLPQAILLGVIAGVMELIPNVGPTLAAIPAVLLALLFGSTNFEINYLVFALIVVAFYVLVQLMENQLIVPKIMGEAVNLPTLVVLIGTIAGAGAFGILGALLATPAIATGNLVFRYIYGKIMEKPPLPPPVEEKPGILNRMEGFLAGLQNQFNRGKRSSSGEWKGR